MPTDEQRIAQAGMKLWRGLWDRFISNGYGEMDSFDFETLAREAGLIETVTYDPAVHGEIEAEPGDPIWYPTELGAMMSASSWLDMIVNGEDRS